MSMSISSGNKVHAGATVPKSISHPNNQLRRIYTPPATAFVQPAWSWCELQFVWSLGEEQQRRQKREEDGSIPTQQVVSVTVILINTVDGYMWENEGQERI